MDNCGYGANCYLPYLLPHRGLYRSFYLLGWVCSSHLMLQAMCCYWNIPIQEGKKNDINHGEVKGKADNNWLREEDPRLLYYKARFFRGETGDNRFMTKEEASGNEHIALVLKRHFSRPWILFSHESIIACLSTEKTSFVIEELRSKCFSFE
jgi:hypothetical protein